MFTHVIDFNIRTDRRDVLLNYFEKDALPQVKTATGFVDITLMHYEDEVTRYTTVCFWETRDHCMKFVNERLPKLLAPITEHLTRPPEMKSLIVDRTTITKVAAAEAA